jgi:hypothetical protein
MVKMMLWFGMFAFAMCMAYRRGASAGRDEMLCWLVSVGMVSREKLLNFVTRREQNGG